MRRRHVTGGIGGFMLEPVCTATATATAAVGVYQQRTGDVSTIRRKDKYRLRRCISRGSRRDVSNVGFLALTLLQLCGAIDLGKSVQGCDEHRHIRRYDKRAAW